jgi:hypothetical protein
MVLTKLFLSDRESNPVFGDHSLLMHPRVSTEIPVSIHLLSAMSIYLRLFVGTSAACSVSFS